MATDNLTATIKQAVASGSLAHVEAVSISDMATRLLDYFDAATESERSELYRRLIKLNTENLSVGLG